MTIGENRDGRYEELRRDMLVENCTSHEIPTMKPVGKKEEAEEEAKACFDWSGGARAKLYASPVRQFFAK